MAGGTHPAQNLRFGQQPVGGITVIFSDFDSYIDEYTGSQQFLFVDPAIKEYADVVLRAFFEKTAARGANSLETLTAKTVEAVLLQDMGGLVLPLQAKRAVPNLLEDFFGYLKDTGRFPAAGSWQICVESVGSKFRDSIREDGTTRGETFKKNYSETGRNDPCICGSGKKFKKCCGPLIGY